MPSDILRIKSKINKNFPYLQALDFMLINFGIIFAYKHIKRARL